ncbi:hypothetical protein K505DRAFT_368952, partial [Melanomma pulvis-pyrius CBS 109.77]
EEEEEEEEEEDEDEEEELEFEYEEDEVNYGAYGAYAPVGMDHGYNQQNAQMMAGATQNAPIELSDSD